MPVIRRGEAADLAQVAAIQQESPEAARWNVSEYLQYQFWVAAEEGLILGYVVSRTVSGDEREVLNVAVAPRFRRRGVARELLHRLLGDGTGSVFLEVRESNRSAREFYQHIGFQQVGSRKNYYDFPPEAAIVMKFHSC
jgi:ribosomal-protein-alanine N-acetyltransferase